MSTESHPETLEAVLITDELRTRPSRPPEYARENRDLLALTTRMAHAPATLLQGLVDAALDLCGAESAGISIEEVGDGDPVFRWHATAGRLANFVGTTVPRYFSPCGDVLARECALLMADPARHYPYIDSLGMPFREVLLIPFRSGEKPVGTIWWVVAHGDQRQFDAEHRRLASKARIEDARGDHGGGDSRRGRCEPPARRRRHASPERLAGRSIDDGPHRPDAALADRGEPVDQRREIHA